MQPVVTVLGAAGFIGRHVVTALLDRGCAVRAFVHVREELPSELRARVASQRGDVRDLEAVRAVVGGCSAVVNCVGAKSDEPHSEAVNVGGARHLVQASREYGVRRIVQISTQAVKIAHKGVYAQTKLAADELLLNGGLDVTVLRPSVVYGPGRSGVFSTMEAAMDRLPLVPVLGSGRWISYPIFVDDVADAVAHCLRFDHTIGQCYDLGGPEAVSLDELLDRLAALAGHRVAKLHIPYAMALFAVRLLKRLMPRAPISISNVLGSNQPIAFDDAAARRDLDLRPRSLQEGIAAMSGVSASDEEGLRLAAEARRLGRYLLSEELSTSLQRRYVDAARRLFPQNPSPEMTFVRRHPWVLPLLDAAAGLTRRESELRQRLLVMAAVVEASPDFASHYLAPPPSRIQIGGLMVRAGFLSLLKAAAGLCLLPFARRP